MARDLSDVIEVKRWKVEEIFQHAKVNLDCKIQQIEDKVIIDSEHIQQSFIEMDKSFKELQDIE